MEELAAGPSMAELMSRKQANLAVDHLQMTAVAGKERQDAEEDKKRKAEDDVEKNAVSEKYKKAQKEKRAKKEAQKSV